MGAYKFIDQASQQCVWAKNAEHSGVKHHLAILEEGRRGSRVFVLTIDTFTVAVSADYSHIRAKAILAEKDSVYFAELVEGRTQWL